MEPTSLPPVPGDPRSTGPRPRGRGRDVAWVTLAVVLVAATAVQLARLLWRAATDPDVVATGGALFLAFVVTVVWLLTIFWLSVGAWRRSVWGCPFEHLEAAPQARRCPRHRLLAPHERDEPSTGRRAAGDEHGPGP